LTHFSPPFPLFPSPDSSVSGATCAPEENEARATKCFRTLRRPGACFKSHATDLEVHAPRAFGGLKSRPQRGRRAWRRRGHHTCACRSDTCATRNRPAWPPLEFHLPDERSRVGISRNADSRETCAQGTFPHRAQTPQATEPR